MSTEGQCEKMCITYDEGREQDIALRENRRFLRLVKHFRTMGRSVSVLPGDPIGVEILRVATRPLGNVIELIKRTKGLQLEDYLLSPTEIFRHGEFASMMQPGINGYHERHEVLRVPRACFKKSVNHNYCEKEDRNAIPVITGENTCGIRTHKCTRCVNA